MITESISVYIVRARYAAFASPDLHTGWFRPRTTRRATCPSVPKLPQRLALGPTTLEDDIVNR
jgi:hypothetical protein